MPTQLLNHPLAGHLLATLRHRDTQPHQFRVAAKCLTTLLTIQATYGMRTRRESVETPIQSAEAMVLDQGLAAVPVLRAGLGMIEPVVELFPDVAVGYIGLERHEDTAIARSYYSKLPDMRDRYTLCLDPMLATGGSAAQAIGLIKANGAAKVVMVCVVATPEGVRHLQESHPDVQIVTAAVDQGLNDRKYIVPGLGDFGDRLYGTMAG